MKHKNYLLTLLGIALLWSNTAFTMISKKPLLTVAEVTQQRGLITELTQAVEHILTQMEDAAENAEKSSQHNRRIIDTKKNSANKQIDDFEHAYKGLIAPEIAKTILPDLRKNIQEKYEESYEKQAQLQLVKILKVMQKILTIDDLENEKGKAKREVSRAERKTKTRERQKRLKDLRKIIEENYEISWLQIQFKKQNIAVSLKAMRRFAGEENEPDINIRGIGEAIVFFNNIIGAFNKKITTQKGKKELNLMKQSIEKNIEKVVGQLGHREISKILKKMKGTVKKDQETDIDDLKKEGEELVAKLEKLIKKFAYQEKPEEQKFEELLKKINKQYTGIKNFVENKIMGHDSFTQVTENMRGLTVHYNILRKSILLHEKKNKEYLKDLKDNTLKIHKIISSTVFRLKSIPHKKVTKFIKKWVQLIEDTIENAREWHSLFSGKDPDFKRRWVSSKKAYYYSGEWYKEMMGKAEEYEKTAKEFIKSTTFGQSAKYLQKLFNFMRKKGGFFTNEPGGMLNGVYYTVGYPSLYAPGKSTGRVRGWSGFAAAVLKKKKEETTGVKKPTVTTGIQGEKQEGGAEVKEEVEAGEAQEEVVVLEEKGEEKE